MLQNPSGKTQGPGADLRGTTHLRVGKARLSARAHSREDSARAVGDASRPFECGRLSPPCGASPRAVWQIPS